MFFPDKDRPNLYPLSEGIIMSCQAAFPADMPLSCIIGFISRARDGFTPILLRDGLWISGCLTEKFAPTDVPSIQSSFEDLESALNTLEETINLLTQEDVGTLAGTKDWTIIVPIFLEIIKMLMDRYMKKVVDTPEGDVL